MNLKRKRRLQFLGVIMMLAAIVVALVLYALKQNINLFYTPSQIAKQELPIGHTVRIGGMVAKNSIQHAPNSLDVQFTVTDEVNSVVVMYQGILPDLFREGQGIVVLGKLGRDGLFHAAQVLAKHDENYMPPEAKHALQTAKK